MLHGWPEERWAALLDRIAKVTGVTVSLTDVQGGISMSRGGRPPVCERIRSRPEALTFVCAQTNRAMLAEIQQTGKPAVDLCEAGLLRMAVPVMREGKLVGQVTACGNLADREDVDPFFVAQQTGLSEEEAQQIVAKMPASTQESYETLAAEIFAEANGTS